jgi:hypothetical protein
MFIIISSFVSKDKTCGFVNTISETIGSRTLDTKGTTDGSMTKFQIAKELGMQVNSPEFELMLAELPFEEPDMWDMTNNIERGFAKAGLLKYSWSMKMLGTNIQEEEHSELTNSTSLSKRQKGNMFEDAVKEKAKDQVVILFREYHKACEGSNSLVTFVKHVQETSATYKNIIIDYQAQPQDSTTTSRMNELENTARLILDFEMEISGMIARCGRLDKEDKESCDLFAKAAEDKRVEIIDFLSNAKTGVKKAQSYLDSL